MKQLTCAILSLVLLGVVACRGSNDKTVPSSVTKEQVPASSVDEQAGLSRAASSMRSYRATLTVELPGGAVEQGTFAFLVPDRSHFILTFAGGSMTNEMIVIGNDQYAKRGEAWVKIPDQVGLPRVLTTTGGLNQLDAFRTAAATSSLNKGGTDSVNNKQCQIYSHSVGANAFEYCVAENLPLRMKVTATTAIITFFFTDYDQVREINAPI